jgi:hypothetical protein
MPTHRISEQTELKVWNWLAKHLEKEGLPRKPYTFSEAIDELLESQDELTDFWGN